MIRRLQSLWKGSRPETAPEPGAGAGAVYAIGDIHGRADLLEPLLAEILRESTGRPATVVALGDYVDRGPDSRAVVDLLLDLSADPHVGTRFLRGNHDQVLLDFLGDHGLGPYWRQVGGGETLFSYGVEPPATRKHMERWLEAQVRFADALPRQHLDFFRALEPSFTWGDYFFTHAGARPGAPLGEQTEKDLMWIRQPFLEDEERFEKIVVHGHTPSGSPYADHRRIGLDTGAYTTGILTACRFDGSGRLLMQAVERPDGPIEIRRAAL